PAERAGGSRTSHYRPSAQITLAWRDSMKENGLGVESVSMDGARPQSVPADSTILDVRDLHTQFRTMDGLIRAVDGVSFAVNAGASVGIVGESGSGKSVTSLSIMRLIEPPGEITRGQIIFKGRDLTRLSGEEMRRIRGDEISMVFQEPMTAL